MRRASWRWQLGLAGAGAQVPARVQASWTPSSTMDHKGVEHPLSAQRGLLRPVATSLWPVRGRNETAGVLPPCLDSAPFTPSTRPLSKVGPGPLSLCRARAASHPLHTCLGPTPSARNSSGSEGVRGCGGHSGKAWRWTVDGKLSPRRFSALAG